MGLVLARKVGQRIMIGEDIIITVLKHKEPGMIRLDVVAPLEIPVHREEVRDQIQREGRK